MAPGNERNNKVPHQLAQHEANELDVDNVWQRLARKPPYWNAWNMNIKGIKSKNLGMFSIKLDCASYKLDTKLFIFQPTSSFPSYPKEVDWTKFVGMVVGNAYNNITWSQPQHSSAKLAPQSTMPTANPAIKLWMLTIIFILIDMISDITFVFFY